MAKILVVEDDRGLSCMVKDWLIFEHHIVELTDNGQDALEKLKFYEYDLVVLDWELPQLSGIDVLKEFRLSGGATPVLMLTGKGAIQQKEAGFDAGADDYLTKPFHMKELSARLRALLRRPTGMLSDVLRCKDIVLEPANYRVTQKEQELNLLPKEFALLEFFMRHPNQVFSAEALLTRVWSSESDATVDAISTCIKRLRKKIDQQGEPSLIRTIHGVGYKLETS